MARIMHQVKPMFCVFFDCLQPPLLPQSVFQSLLALSSSDTIIHLWALNFTSHSILVCKLSTFCNSAFMQRSTKNHLLLQCLSWICFHGHTVNMGSIFIQTRSASRRCLAPCKVQLELTLILLMPGMPLSSFQNSAGSNFCISPWSLYLTHSSSFP